MSQVSITNAVLQNAILDIYSDLNIPATGRLTLAHLESEWDKTGLRLDDLVRGIEYLLNEGILSVYKQDTPCLQITEYGHQVMVAPPTPQSIRERIMTTRALHQAQKRMTRAHKEAETTQQTEGSALSLVSKTS